MSKLADSNNLPDKLSYLLDHADYVFSRWVRFMPSENEYTACFFCGYPYKWLNMDCSHFRKRRHMATRFDPLNCQPVCRTCHQKYENDDGAYGAKINFKFGNFVAEQLIKQSHETKKFTTDELKEMITKWNKDLTVKARI